MENLEVMEAAKGLDGANQDFPDEVLIEEGLLLFVLHNFLVQVAIGGEVHNDAEGLALVQEALLVANNVLVLDRCQNADFI